MSLLRKCSVFQASFADGVYTSASRMPVTTCSPKRMVAALPKTYNQLSDLIGMGCAAASIVGLKSPSRCSSQLYMPMTPCFRLAMDRLLPCCRRHSTALPQSEPARHLRL